MAEIARVLRSRGRADRGLEPVRPTTARGTTRSSSTCVSPTPTTCRRGRRTRPASSAVSRASPGCSRSAPATSRRSSARRSGACSAPTAQSMSCRSRDAPNCSITRSPWPTRTVPRSTVTAAARSPGAVTCSRCSEAARLCLLRKQRCANTAIRSSLCCPHAEVPGHRRRPPRPLDGVPPRHGTGRSRQGFRRRHRHPREVDDPGAGASGIACGVVRNNYFQPAMQELMQAVRRGLGIRPAAYSYNPVGYMAIGPQAQEADLTAATNASRRSATTRPS